MKKCKCCGQEINDRWFYNTREPWAGVHPESDLDDNPECYGWIEVPADDHKYVEDCLKLPGIGEYEYRLAEQHELYIGRDSGLELSARWVYGDKLRMVFVRKPEPKSVWRECEIVLSKSGTLYVKDFYTPTSGGEMASISDAWSHAINRRLSPQFSCAENPGVWYNAPTIVIRGRPCQPIRMRLWEGGAE